MHYSNTGYLYKFIIPPTHKKRDFGVDRFYDRQATRIKKEEDSKFLEGFYRGKKSHNLWSHTYSMIEFIKSIRQLFKSHYAVNCCCFWLRFLFSLCKCNTLLWFPDIEFFGPVCGEVELNIWPVKGMQTIEHFWRLSHHHTQVIIMCYVFGFELAFIILAISRS